MCLRDIRQEFTRFKVELQSFSMVGANDLFRSFGKGSDDILGKLRHFNEWFTINLPYFSYELTKNLQPVLEHVKKIFGETVDLGGQLATDFIHFVGALGDPALANAPLTFGNFTKAIGESVDAVARLIEGMLRLETNMGLEIDAILQIKSGNLPAAIADFKKMQQVTAPALLANTPYQGVGASPQALKAAIIGTAIGLGVPPELALAVAAKESGGGQVSAIRQFGPNGQVLESNKGALGVMQIEPYTAKKLGLDPMDVGQNIFAGVQVLKEGLGLYNGDTAAALRYYYSGRAYSKNPDVERYAQTVLTIEGGIHITLPWQGPNAMPEELARQVQGALEESLKRGAARATTQLQSGERLKVQRNLNEFQSWSYGQ